MQGSQCPGSTALTSHWGHFNPVITVHGDRNEARSAGEQWLGSWPVLLWQEHALRLSSSTAFKFLIGTPCEVS